MHTHANDRHERGMALLMALLALLLISAIGLGMMYMSTTETAINSNYKDTQTAFFSVRGGLEEMRDRMRKNSGAAIAVNGVNTMPTNTPPNPNSIVYIINPAGPADVVNPTAFGNQYFDDEFCHEQFNAVLGQTWSLPCLAAQAPPAGAVQPFLASYALNTNTAATLKYKWVRLTLKQNATSADTAQPPTKWVDSTQGATAPVCWDATNSREVPSTTLGFATCALASAGGLNVEPVYLVTSLAITPQGSRRMSQYEVAALNITPPPAALALDGPAAVFNPAPNSANYFSNGTDSGVAGYTGPGVCTPTPPALVPAVSTGDAAGVNNLVGTPPGTGSIPNNRLGNYTGSTPAPAIVNSGPTGSNQLAGQWSSPAQLNNMVNYLANGADQTLTCGINGVGGAPCNFPAASGLGTDAAPMITVVNGDFNMGSNSGAGILIVTGTLAITGNSSFDGLILVVGQGLMTETGAGNGQFNGSIFLAKTNNSVAPFAPLPALGTPVIQWNGGGTNGIQYNSCWANIGSNLHYMVVASREEMY